MKKILTNFFNLEYQSIRNISVNQYRQRKGLAPRSKSGPLIETPEFSFVDGRGFAPLSFGAKRRYLRNKYFAETIVKYMKQFEIAKNLKSVRSCSYSNKNLDSNKSYISYFHPKSNLSLIKFKSSKDESIEEKKYRLMREDNQKWNHEFWAANNTAFQKHKLEYSKKLNSKNISQQDFLPFYQKFLNDNYQKHLDYNKEWYKRQFKLLKPAFKAFIASKKRSISLWLKRS